MDEIYFLYIISIKTSYLRCYMLITLINSGNQAHMVEASYRVKECTKRLRRKLRRRPTNEEIALDTGMPIKRVEAAVNLPKYSVSLDSKIGSTDMTYQV